MSILSEILDFNKRFVEAKDYRDFETSRFPDKKLAILTCMETRLLELLHKAMNLKNGDAKMIKNAGAMISHPYSHTMRSILIAVHELGVREIIAVGHHECGMTGLTLSSFLHNCKKNGIAEETINNAVDSAGIDLNEWVTGFDNVEESIRKSVGIIKNHPLLPADIPVHGLIIHPHTGKLDLVVDGYAHIHPIS